MAVSGCNCKLYSCLLLFGVLLSMVLQISSDTVQSNRFVGYPKDGQVFKNRRDGTGYHEYEYYNYGFVNCGPRYGYFGGYPYGGIGGYPGYDYHGYAGYPYGLNGHYAGPFY